MQGFIFTFFLWEVQIEFSESVVEIWNVLGPKSDVRCTCSGLLLVLSPAIW